MLDLTTKINEITAQVNSTLSQNLERDAATQTVRHQYGTIIQNNKINRTGGLREDGIDTAKLVVEHIETEKFDILGTQELTSLFINNIINSYSQSSILLISHNYLH